MNILTQLKINYGLAYVAIKYSIVGIGFLRTILVASILSVNDMGLLAFYYLILEYAVITVPIGSPNAINKEVSNLKGKNNKTNSKNREVVEIYTSCIQVFTLSFLILIFSIYIIDGVLFNFLPKEVQNTKEIFLLITFLSCFRTYANMHNRLWEKYNRLFLSEGVYSLVYLLGIYIFLNNDDSYYLILYVLAFSNLVAIIIARFYPTYMNFSKINFGILKKSSSIGFFLMLNVVMESLFWGIDRFFIASVLEPDQLAYFHLSHTFARGIMMFYAAITFLFYPLLISLFTDLKNKHDSWDQAVEVIFKMSRFSEGIMVFALIISVLIIPKVIVFLLPQYPDLTTLFHIIILGLTLKGLVFFPMTYLIAVSWHKLLSLISIFFVIAVAFFYWMFGNFYELHAFGYTSIAVVAFLFFVSTMSYLAFTQIGAKNILLIILKYYYKIFTTVGITIFFLTQPNYFTLISNVGIVLILTSLIYLNNFNLILKETIISIYKKDKNNLMKSFR